MFRHVSKKHIPQLPPIPVECLQANMMPGNGNGGNDALAFQRTHCREGARGPMIAAAFLARIAEPLLKLVRIFSQIVQRTSEPTLFACSEGVSKMRCSFGHPLKMRAKRFRNAAAVVIGTVS